MAGDGLKNRNEETVSQGLVSIKYLSLQKGEHQGSRYNQGRSCQQNCLGLDRKPDSSFLTLAKPGLNIIEYRKTNSAYHDQTTHGRVEKEAVAVAHHASENKANPALQKAEIE